MISIRVVARSDDLERLVTEINEAAWDDTNEISRYDPESLASYLERQDTLFLTCHDASVVPPKFLGMASARVEMKPYGKELWLYVDEVDVRSDQRRKGAGTAIMRRLLEIAREKGCEEVWLGADAGNRSANALYQSLEPAHVTSVSGYTYETD
jgi:ribosomal protein S18 acetylase RimI-like enzyme